MMGQALALLMLPLPLGVDIPFRHLRQRRTEPAAGRISPWHPLNFVVLVVVAVSTSLAPRFANRHTRSYGSIPLAQPDMARIQIPDHFLAAKYRAFIYAEPTEAGLMCVIASDHPGLAEQNAQLFVGMLNGMPGSTGLFFTRTEPIQNPGDASYEWWRGCQLSYLYRHPTRDGLVGICLGTTEELAEQWCSLLAKLHREKYQRPLLVMNAPLDM